MNQHTPRRFYLLTYPRTASNLLVKMLGLPKQPNFTVAGEHSGYIFKPSSDLLIELGLRTKRFADWTDEETAQVKTRYQECYDKFLRELNDVPSHHSVFVKEHVSHLIDPVRLSEFAFGSDGSEPVEPGMLDGPDCEERNSTKLMPGKAVINMTLLPGEFLRTWIPTFLIRHPALAFPSLHRALAAVNLTARKNEDHDALLGKQSMTLRWSRSLYEWYVYHSGSSDTWPVVLDADDIMESPELVVKYCRLLCMDPELLCFSWDPTTEKKVSQELRSRQRFLDTLMASNGVKKDKIGGHVIIEQELDKWRDEFGNRVAQTLEGLVRDSMPDYEFLKARRLRV